MTASAGWRLEASFGCLPELFYEKIDPTPVRKPGLAILNRPLAKALGLDPDLLTDPALFAGNVSPPGAQPLAQAYAGHQYGHFTTLGDGRAILLGEQVTPLGERFDIQLKGSGPTPYSRRGDGRAALGPMLREYIISEAMHALGIPTTRSLAVATTGEPVFRQEQLPGAVLTRVAASHLRVGTFEWAAAHGGKQALQALADYAILRHFPEVKDEEGRYLAFFERVMERQAALIAQWMHVGFVHGVMNTDNMSICGETIDYGPCAFMDAYDPATVFSSIDRHGRYAYGKQPHIAQWNLARLAEALLPLFHEDEKQAIELANESINHFQIRFQTHWLSGMRSKLGLSTEEGDDTVLIQTLLEWMLKSKADWTQTFAALHPERQASSDEEFCAWHQQWTTRLGRQSNSPTEVVKKMRASNPVVIPRNHKVEEALAAASENDDLTVMHRLLKVLAAPFDYELDLNGYQEPSPSGCYQTFCGT